MAFIITKRFFKTLIVLGMLAFIISAQAGSISAESVQTSASVSGNGGVSGTATVNSGNMIERSVSVSGEVQTGSQPASFSFRDSGKEWGSDGITTVAVRNAQVSASGSIRGSGAAAANASVYSAGGEDAVPNPNQIWLNTFILAETSTKTDTPGSRATASASASGYAIGSGRLDHVGTIDTFISGKVEASSNAQSRITPSSSYSSAMIGADANLLSDGTSGVKSCILGLSDAKGENAGASASANGEAHAYANAQDFQITRTSGKTTGTSSVKNGGSEVTAEGMIIAIADPSGSDAMIFSNTTSSSSAPSFSGSGSASASGSAKAEIMNDSGGYDIAIPVGGSVNSVISQTGAGNGTADALILGCVSQPEAGFTWNFDITPSGYIPDTGLFVQDLDAGLSLKSAVENAASINGTSPRFRGSATSSVSGSALSGVSSKKEEYSVESSGTTQVKNSVSDPGMASGESRIEAVLLKDISSGTVGAYLIPDSVSMPINGSIAGGSILFDQFTAIGTKSSSSGSVKGASQSAGSVRDNTTSSTSEGTLTGSVSATSGAGSNTAALLGSVHAAGLDSPYFSDSLFDASVLVSESNAADTIDLTGTATGTVTGKTKASSQQFEEMVQNYSSESSGEGKATTAVTSQKGIGLSVAGLGSVSLVQPVLDVSTPVALVEGAEGTVSYAIARGGEPTARVTSSAEVSGKGSSAGSVNFCGSSTDPFILTGSGQLTSPSIKTAVEARTKNESEAIGFGFTAQRASVSGSNGVSEGITGFGTGTAGSDNASVKADARISRLDLSNLARVDTEGPSITPTNISITFGNAIADSNLNPLTNIANANVSIQSVDIEFNPDPGAGGNAWGTLIRSAKAITNQNPNVAEGYYEAIASSAGPQSPVDLNLTPFLVGVYP